MIEVPEGQTWILEMIQNILIEVLTSIAEQERLTTRKKQREGIEVAKKKGKHLGKTVFILLKSFQKCIKDGKGVI